MDQPPMKLRQRKNYIPKDVVLNILTRRVKSLVRFRFVSKSLNHSITTPNFVSTQFKFHIYDSFPFLLYTTYTSSGHICCVISQRTHRIPRNILNYNCLVLVMELYVLIGIWMAKRIYIFGTLGRLKKVNHSASTSTNPKETFAIKFAFNSETNDFDRFKVLFQPQTSNPIKVETF